MENIQYRLLYRPIFRFQNIRKFACVVFVFFTVFKLKLIMATTRNQYCTNAGATLTLMLSTSTYSHFSLSNFMGMSAIICFTYVHGLHTVWVTNSLYLKKLLRNYNPTRIGINSKSTMIYEEKEISKSRTHFLSIS